MIKIHKITDDKLEKIKGGATSAVWIGVGIASLVIFITGILEGVTNPKGCGE